MKKKLQLLLLFTLAFQTLKAQRVYSVVFDQLPRDFQIYQRNDSNEAEVKISGIIEITGWDYMSVVVTRNSASFQYQRSNFQYNSKGIGTFSISTKIKAELADYNFDVYAVKGKDSLLMATKKNIAAGEIFLINGQSNGAAYNVEYPVYLFTNKYCRTFGLAKENQVYTEADTLWSQSNYSIGVWGLELQKLLLEKYQMPSCIINGSVHGTTINAHQRDNNNPTSIGSIYGKLLYRAQKARVDKNFRAFFFWQGENDIVEDDPWLWPEKFEQLFASWQSDYKNLSKYYIFQVNVLTVKNYGSGVLRDYQRKLQDLHKPWIESIATVGNQGYDGGHYTTEGYKVFANEILRRIERDYFGVKPSTNVSSPNIRKAFYTSSKKNEIALVFDEGQEMLWKNDTTLTNNDGTLATQYMKDYFMLDNKLGTVSSGKASKNTIILTLNQPSFAKKITYLLPYFPYDDTEKRSFYGGPYLQNVLGVKALTFQDLDIYEKDPDLPTKLDSVVLSAKATFFNKVSLNWQSVSGASKYIIERKASNQDFKIIATLDSSSQSYLDTNLTANTIYTYRIQALNESISSDYSLVEIQTPALLATPNLQATAISHERIQVQWLPVSEATHYILERKISSENTFQKIFESEALLSFTDTNLIANQTYFYRLKANNLLTESAFATAETRTFSILGTEYEPNSSVLIYPNPSKGSLIIKLKTLDNYIVSILDFIGNKAFEQTFFKQNSISLDLSTLKKGLYLVLINNNQEIYSQKIYLE
ncbi:sialate O-acetylesterase [Arcicella rigui]|uniref:T9SS type A sorting domain-containing protein n=1 Tax=Arcicella rigui TaxID=797020 RepID=A0ABU5QAU1_9BACT|nr:sialate O-acetylesterase [Arcicella rigui]MEA5139853.1 T9SS type A sorting domain-containing protein [Arcicella rigui]